MNANQIATRAAELVSGDREKTHGDKATNFANIAIMWNAWFTMKWGAGPQIAPGDVGTLMSLLKIARTESGEFNLDDYIDGAAYLAISGELSAPRGGEGE